MVGSSPLPEFAYYYPEPYWSESSNDYIKNLLLFFDGIATLVPAHAKDRALEANPTLVEPMLGSGLLRQMDPVRMINSDAVERMAAAVTAIVRDPSFAREEGVFESLSYSRLGVGAASQITDQLMTTLHERGFGKPADGSSFSLDRRVRQLVLVLWSQILRQPGQERGLSLLPVTDSGLVGASLMLAAEALGNNTTTVHVGSVVQFDQEQISVNLESVPLDEILDFRRQHGRAFMEYRKSLLIDVTMLSLLDESERERAFHDRALQIMDAANDLKKRVRFAFNLKSVGAFTLGAAGAGIATFGGSYAAAGVAGAGALLGLVEANKPSGIFSYLFEAQKTFGERGRPRG